LGVRVNQQGNGSQCLSQEPRPHRRGFVVVEWAGSPTVHASSGAENSAAINAHAGAIGAQSWLLQNGDSCSRELNTRARDRTGFGFGPGSRETFDRTLTLPAQTSVRTASGSFIGGRAWASVGKFIGRPNGAGASKRCHNPLGLISIGVELAVVEQNKLGRRWRDVNNRALLRGSVLNDVILLHSEC
jgi:hypothetical protein